MRATAATAVTVLVTGALGTDIAAAVGELKLPGLDEVKPVPVTEVRAEKAKGRDDAARDARKAAADVEWPRAATGEAELPERRGAARKVGTLPVSVGLPKGGGTARDTAPPQTAQVQVLDRATTRELGVDGVVIAVRGTGGGADGKVKVTLDYSAFEQAYGAGWASRLSFVRLPHCALDNPDARKCATAEPLVTDNDADDRTLTADVPVDGTSTLTGDPVEDGTRTQLARAAASADQSVTLLAATAAPSGGGGDYKATPLSPSGQWAAGSSSGAFTWSYDLQIPEAPGGLEPDLDLGYNSQSLDGRTAATNNQTNWVGDGWSLTENYIERRYTSCNDDKTGGNNTANNGELCWGSYNATMSLNGQSHELVRDDTSGTWKLKDDDGTRIERLTDTARANGDNDGEYWRITTTDGTQYHFGYHRLPGWTSGKAETNSAWTVPVYGNQSGEPCHKTAFADSYCQQAWRWNLDYVVDTNDNATAYYYAAETNRYARGASATTGLGTVTEYQRGGYPLRIEYGLRAGNLYGTNAAAAKVEFTVAERCLPDASFDCAPSKMTDANAKRWPDVPVDQYCRAGEDCKAKIAPTFWTTKRLTNITTKVLAGGSYAAVDSWALRHQFPDPGDGTTPALWLAGITRTGHTADQAQSLPEVTFLGQQLANRVDTTGDGIPPIVRYRVRQVNTETGSTIGVTYSAPDCAPGSLPAESTNTKRCYPVYWSSADSPAADYKPVKDWFHKYVVTRVLENDLVGGSPTEQTDYTYVGGAAWAKSEDEFTKAEHRTYSDFRGYGEVRTQVGNGTDGPRLDSRTRYFRGIEGAQVADFEGNEVADHPVFAGVERAEATYEGGAVLAEETTTPWRSGAIATRARTGLPALTAYRTDVAQETSRSPLKGGGWQRTKSERTFDAYGMLATETDHGDTAKAGDETCTRMTYARNTGANILELEASEKTTTGTCAAPGELIAEERTYYDGSTTLGAAPVKGNATRQDENDDKGTGFITAATTSYDAYGRPVSVTDAQNRAMTTEYVPATGMPTKMVVTNPLGHTLTTEIDAKRGVETAEIDTNGNRTDIAYDALGRVTKVWEPGRGKDQYPDSPSAAYEYRISRTEAPAVTTRELRGDGSTETSYTLYDGLLRERQTQMPVLGGTGGRVLTETLYDSRGLEWKVYDDYYATGDPEPVLVAGDDTKAPAAVRITHDGAGRPTETVALKYGTETRRATTVYDGNHTTVVPPKGGTARTTVTDALDRPVEEIEYTNEARTASQSTKYAYDARGLLERITDPAGTVRTFAYDARGREVRSEDPDQGTTTMAYDVMDRRVSTTDARGVTLTTGYDALGRVVSVKEGATLRSEWVYDTVAKGELSEARRYVDGQAYTQKVTGYTNDYQPTGLQVVIPAAQGDLAGTYSWGFTYNDRTGLLTQINQPAIGDLPAERVVTRYDGDDQAQGLTAGGRILVNSNTYDPFGRVLRTEYNDQSRRLYRSWSYDEHTGELLRVTTDRTLAPQRVDDTHYTYDPAGNVKRIKTSTGQGEDLQTDTQCFTTDALQRLTEAWTSTDDCAAGPSKANVGGPRPYWTSYSYDALGNRTKEVKHDTSGDPAKDSVRTYGYGPSGSAQGGPNALASVETVAGGTASTESFAYDATGNTVSRQEGNRQQTLTWDAENQLAKVEEPGKATTEYVYDASGERMLRKDALGTTLYLPGGNELLLQPDGKKAGTRYYDFDGETVAVRTSGQLEFLFTDHHGTGTTAIDATTQEVTHRWLDPFGAERGLLSGVWPVDRGFVGGITDSTGLTQLGARAYDPTLGRFISVDPLVDYTESQRMNPYAYANNNPVSFSDPDGLFFGKIKNAIKKTVKKVTKKVTKVVKKTVKKVKKAVKKVTKVVKKVAKKVKRVVKKVARAVKKVVKRTVRVVKKYAKKTYRAVKRTYSKAKSAVKRGVQKAASVTKRAAKATWSGAKKVGRAVTSERAAEILGHVSTITGTIAGVAAMVPGGQGVAAAFGAASAATGLASAGIYALNGQGDKAAGQLAGTVAAITLGGAGAAVKLIRGSGGIARGARAALGDGLSGPGIKLAHQGASAMERGVGRASIGLHTTAANVGGWMGLSQDKAFK
ncbi:RHS repeat-associated core domain-containing protein [Streptomyces sp. B93]|uniref:RHS repeat domain-containing protein n=1 Tax=Streptomyces sp. B93 TaxID=2824875 RepID=UPI0027E51018|nr:RHS repeat-associated core domain-containing protein [Streptomyces sp. B93]